MSNPITPSYFHNAYERFFFLHGHTDDEFCPPQLGIYTLEEMLFYHLQQLEYKRIIFYNGRQKIYFHDFQSRHASSPHATAEKTATPNAPRPRQPSKLCAGPIGLQRLHTRTSDEQEPISNPALPPMKQTITYSSLQLGRMSDTDVVGFISHCMQEEQPKTAIIFTDGIDFIVHFDVTAQRTMAAMLTRFGQLPSTNHNLCLFILPDTNPQNIRMVLEQNEWHFLLNQFFDKDNTPSKRVISLGSPRQDEVLNLLHYWRLKRQLFTDWQLLPAAVLAITRQLCTKGQSLKSLSYQLSTAEDLSAKSLKQLAKQTAQKPAIERLRQMHGLEIVLQKMERLLAREQERLNTQEIHEESNLKSGVTRLLPVVALSEKTAMLHVVLKGNPGTGKTTVAYLIAEIYREAGLLELGHVVKASREDLVAGYVGQTAIQTAQKIADAMGGVLFVDEAYRLVEGGEHDFGREAIETIMEAMSNHVGKFAVIIAGYPQRIEQFLNTNPGLRRRFGEGNMLTIPDYSPETLQTIFTQQVAREHRYLAPELQEKLPLLFHNWYQARNPENFGNAGDVLNFYQMLDEQRIMRVRTENDKQQRFTLSLADIPENMRAYLDAQDGHNIKTLLAELDKLIGLQQVKQTIRGLINAIKVQQLRGEAAHIVAGHYVFSGNPGTGKTMMARYMGRVFKALGILKQGQLIEATRADLVGSYLGETALKTRRVIENSLDGVLFIDEVYQLIESNEDEFGKEAVQTLVADMENYRHRLCVIVAGYPESIKTFLNSNPGLPSRFIGHVFFENYTATEMLAIFQAMATEKHLTIATDLLTQLQNIFKQWQTNTSETFGNARDVRNLLEDMIVNQNNRLVENHIMDKTLLYQLERVDLPEK
ncbi:AAA family ATPase [Beggiatoa leptomitoformis]|uniref:AAA family ATPase n=1 Tax=Beggiatoa leptomitoformis TaxID=288004 RepID=A0A2N9YGH8_9GAMM|nr:AAA family ATPase [Beggiatoa leptomitoformis]AUI69628.1 AAA family ATPase [Beggiatoa leptomitoformis]QGX03696.1 AAA family ATPase [Beggiatoa leptomitoformis]